MPSANARLNPRAGIKNTARSAARCAGNVLQPSPSAARKNASARRSVLRPSGIAVSYTHLDVYKRQGVGRVRPTIDEDHGQREDAGDDQRRVLAHHRKVTGNVKKTGTGHRRDPAPFCQAAGKC